MRTWMLTVLLALAPLRAQADIDPIALYGEAIRFDVVRNGEVVGEHETRFAKDDNALIVTSRMSLEIFALIFPVYAFDYSSVETWKDDRLNALKVRILDGHKKVNIDAAASGDTLRITGPEGEASVDGTILSTNHWNASVVRNEKVLNTLTGKINRVSIRRSAVETLSFPDGPLEAVRYDYEGDLRDTSVWYDRQGRWVKLRFKARDGSTIDYRCKTCEAEG